MPGLRVEVQTLSPLLIGSLRSRSALRTTYRYVPGSMLRGAAAAVLLGDCLRPERERGMHDQCAPDRRATCRFQRVFAMPDRVVFSNCYPVRYARFKGQSLPFPLTARTCKAQPGFVSDETPDAHGVSDTLIRDVVHEEVSSRGRVPMACLARCQRCPGDVTEPSGFYEFDASGKGHEITAQTSRFPHVAINRRRRVAEDQMLYTQETVNEGTVFVGAIKVPDAEGSSAGDVLATVAEALEKITLIGGSRSRGLGRVRVSVSGEPTRHPPSRDALAQRLGEFNASLEKERGFYRELGLPATDCRPLFTLDLTSDCIATANGMPTLVVRPDDLGLDAGRVKLVRAFARSTIVGGWNDAAGLPRERRLAIAAGSVFVYRVDQGNLAELVPVLAALEDTGVGRDRERGHGQVVVCSPIHWRWEHEC